MNRGSHKGFWSGEIFRISKVWWNNTYQVNPFTATQGCINWPLSFWNFRSRKHKLNNVQTEFLLYHCFDIKIALDQRHRTNGTRLKIKRYLRSIGRHGNIIRIRKSFPRTPIRQIASNSEKGSKHIRFSINNRILNLKWWRGWNQFSSLK